MEHILALKVYLVFLAVLCLSYFSSRRNSASVSFNTLTYLALIMLFSYIPLLFGLGASVAFKTSTIAALAFFAYQWKTAEAHPAGEELGRKRFLCLELVFLLIVSTFWCMRLSMEVTGYWDEVNHWMRAFFVLDNGHFPSKVQYGHAEYLPGLSIIQLFFLHAVGKSEGVLFMSQGLLVSTALSTIAFEGSSHLWNPQKPWVAVFSAMTSYVALAFFSFVGIRSIHSLDAELPLSAAAAAVLVALVVQRKNPRQLLLHFFLVGFLVVLIKKSGAYYLIGLTSIVLPIMVNEHLNETGYQLRKVIRSCLKSQLTTAILGGIFALGSWTIYRKIYGIYQWDDVLPSNGILVSIQYALGFGHEDKLKMQDRLYWAEIFHGSLSYVNEIGKNLIKYSYLLLINLIALAITYYHSIKRGRLSRKAAFLRLAASIFPFLCVNIFFFFALEQYYLFYFENGLHSFDRFVGSWVWMLTAGILFCWYTTVDAKKFGLNLVFAITFLVISIGSIKSGLRNALELKTPSILGPDGKYEHMDFSRTIRSFREEIMSDFGTKADSIYIYYPRFDGFALILSAKEYGYVRSYEELIDKIQAKVGAGNPAFVIMYTPVVSREEQAKIANFSRNCLILSRKEYRIMSFDGQGHGSNGGPCWN